LNQFGGDEERIRIVCIATEQKRHMQVMTCGELSRSILGIRDVYSSLRVRQKTIVIELTVANVVETSLQSDRSIFKNFCRHFFHAGDLGGARHYSEIRQPLLRQLMFLTIATTDEFCNDIPISCIDIVCQINDVIADNTDIKLNLLVA
jgi:hypothetical protein